MRPQKHNDFARAAPGLPAVLMVALLSLSLPVLPGCALFEEQVGFRAYELRDIEYDAAVELVRDVTAQYCANQFGGVGIEWDSEGRNLTVDEIYLGDRRLNLYIHIEPEGTGVIVELLALVHTLESSGRARIWGHPQQDVPVEEDLYDAYLAAWLDLRSEG